MRGSMEDPLHINYPVDITADCLYRIFCVLEKNMQYNAGVMNCMDPYVKEM